jgi:hypothetical protein
MLLLLLLLLLLGEEELYNWDRMEAILSDHIVIDDWDGDDEDAKEGDSLNAWVILAVGVRDGLTDR